MKLKFNENGKFKILLFGDLHEQYDYAESPNFKDMQKLMNASLDRYSPDLCVLLGDVCSTHRMRRGARKIQGYGNRRMQADV